MPNAFIKKLRGYTPLDAADEACLEAACQHPRTYAAGHDLICEGDEPGPVFVVLEGWAFRYKILPGGRRQIIAFLMPGDFCDIHVSVLNEMDHNIGTLTWRRSSPSRARGWRRCWRSGPRSRAPSGGRSSSTRAPCAP